MESQSDKRIREQDTCFLPDFCSIQVVFSLVLMGELLAVILVLSKPLSPIDSWRNLGMISLFIQWVTLCSAAMFCLIRSKVMHWNNAITASIAFFAMLLVTAFMSEAAFWTLQTIGYDKLLPKMGHSEFLFRNIGVASIVCALILRYFYIQDQWKRQTKAEMESRIQALQSRIRPHFLFNTMNTIAPAANPRP